VPQTWITLLDQLTVSFLVYRSVRLAGHTTTRVMRHSPRRTINALSRRAVPVETCASYQGPAATSHRLGRRWVRGNGAMGADQSATRRIIMPSAPAPVRARSLNSPIEKQRGMPDARAGRGPARADGSRRGAGVKHGEASTGVCRPRGPAEGW